MALWCLHAECTMSCDAFLSQTQLTQHELECHSRGMYEAGVMIHPAAEDGQRTARTAPCRTKRGPRLHGLVSYEVAEQLPNLRGRSNHQATLLICGPRESGKETLKQRLLFEFDDSHGAWEAERQQKLQEARRAREAASRDVALVAVAVDIRLMQIAAEVTLVQTFHNKGEELKEATYEFPKEETAVICHFEATIGDKTVVGIVKEKHEARRQYAAAAAAGHGAYLVEQTDLDLITIKLGNIPANEKLVVKLCYTTENSFTDGAIGFTMPGAFLSSPVSLHSPDASNLLTTLSVKLVAEFKSSLREIRSHNHTMCLTTVPAPSASGSVIYTYSMELVPRGQSSSSSSPSSPTTPQDLDLRFILEDPHSPMAMSEYADVAGRFRVTHAVLLSFVPQLPGKAVNSDIIFIVDRSGSMGGSLIQRASVTLLSLLRNLPLNCRFNIVGFGTTHTSLFPEPVPPTRDNLQIGRAHCRDLKADLGGTELISPLTAVLATPIESNYRRSIFLLTDGEVDARQRGQCVDIVRAHSATTTCFTFGVGKADHELVQELANAGKGKAVFLTNDSNLKRTIKQQFVDACHPTLVDMRLEWGDTPHCIESIAHLPHELRPVFAAEAYRAFALIQTKLPSELSHLLPTLQVRLVGRVPGTEEEVVSVCTLDLRTSKRGLVLHRLVAREAISDLVDGVSSLHDDGSAVSSSSAQQPSTTAVAKAAVQWGVRYNIVSQHTSLVAVQRRASPQETALLRALSMPAECVRLICRLTHGGAGNIIRSASSSDDSGTSTSSNNSGRSPIGSGNRERERAIAGAKASGKPGMAFACYLDRSKDERARGVTISCFTPVICSRHNSYVLHAPGRGWVRTLTAGSPHLVMALLLVPAETYVASSSSSSSSGPTTSERAIDALRMQALVLLHTGVRNLVVGISKVDTCEEAENRFWKVKGQTIDLLVQAGWDRTFVLNSVPFIPISALSGSNVSDASPSPSWWKGTEYTPSCSVTLVRAKTLLDVLDNFQPDLAWDTAYRGPSSEPLRMCLNGVYRIKGVGNVVTGRLSRGSLQLGDEVVFVPQRNPQRTFATIKDITKEHKSVPQAMTGDLVGVHVQLAVDNKQNRPKFGDVMLLAADGMRLQACQSFCAELVLLETVTLQKDVPLAVFVGAARVLCSVTRRNHDGTHPVSLTLPQFARVCCNFLPQRPVVVDTFRSCPTLGRIVVEVNCSVVALGTVSSVT